MFSIVFYNVRKNEEVRLDTSFTDHCFNLPAPIFRESGGHLSMITDTGFFRACQKLLDSGYRKIIVCDRDQHYGCGRNLPN